MWYRSAVLYSTLMGRGLRQQHGMLHSNVVLYINTTKPEATACRRAVQYCSPRQQHVLRQCSTVLYTDTTRREAAPCGTAALYCTLHCCDEARGNSMWYSSALLCYTVM